jgi:hypothetical protein
MQRRENNIQSFEKLRLVSSSYFLVVVTILGCYGVSESHYLAGFSGISFLELVNHTMFILMFFLYCKFWFLDKYWLVLNWKSIEQLINTSFWRSAFCIGLLLKILVDENFTLCYLLVQFKFKNLKPSKVWLLLLLWSHQRVLLGFCQTLSSFAIFMCSCALIRCLVL